MNVKIKKYLNEVLLTSSPRAQKFWLMMVVLSLFVIGGLLSLAVSVSTDYRNSFPPKTVVVILKTKGVDSAHTTLVRAGKVTIPIRHSTRHWITFGNEAKEFYFPVRKTLFDSLSVGKKIAVDFEFDMQSHLYQPKTVRLVK